MLTNIFNQNAEPSSASEDENSEGKSDVGSEIKTDNELNALNLGVRNRGKELDNNISE